MFPLSESPVNPFAAQQRLLIERLNYFLETLHADLRADVLTALKAEGKLLSSSDSSSQQSTSGHWPLMTLFITQGIAPEIDIIAASSVAVAVECFVCALDLLDDMEDGDQTPTLQVLGEARVLNVSTALLMLAQRCILSLAQQNVALPLVYRLLDTLQRCALVATAGQHRDLLAEQKAVNEPGREECIEIAAAKAGSIMSLACQLGAICSSADDEVYELFAQMGETLGIAHQLDNDSHDLYDLLYGQNTAFSFSDLQHISKGRKSDLIRGKKTLPIVLASQLGFVLQETEQVDDKKEQEYIKALNEGITVCWGISQLYRERAQDFLNDIEARGIDCSMLRVLLGFSQE